jgi:hypothetical protein
MNIRSTIFGSGSASEEPLLKGKQPKGAKADELHSISVAREEKRRADTRDQDRHRLPDEQIRVSHEGKNHSVQLINLSGGGAMIDGKFKPKLWDRVELHFGEEGGIECAVCWLKGTRVGLEFAHETRLDCSVDEQAVVLREVIARSFPDLEFEAGMEPEAAIGEGREEHRGDRRHPLIWSGMLHYDFDSTPVRLRNISSSGAQIECESPPPVGAEPLLDLGGAGSAFGTVTWVVGDHAGLRFKEPFDLSRLSRARPELTPMQWERPAYLNPGAAADSPWAKEWDRMSLGELRDELEGFIKR